jgi:hypothetical protein
MSIIVKYILLIHAEGCARLTSDASTSSTQRFRPATKRIALSPADGDLQVDRVKQLMQIVFQQATHPYYQRLPKSQYVLLQHPASN